MDDTLPDVVAAAVVAMRAGDREGLDRLRTEGYVDRRPQSGELVRGREQMRELEVADPIGPPRIVNLRRVAGLDRLWTIEARTESSDGGEGFVVTILELEGDRIAGSTTYACERLEAPAWRAAHVVPLDPDRQPAALRPAAELSDAEVARIGERHIRSEGIRDWDDLRRLRGVDWSMDWPQSGERIPSHEADVAIHSSYPGYPKIGMQRLSSAAEDWQMSPMYTRVRVHGAGPLIVIEGVNTYPSSGTWFVVNLLETGDKHIRRETAYFGRPTQPASWRSQWVERFDPLSPR